MPSDQLYWNSVGFDSDESLTNTFPRDYIDPWDLENYAYLREHLDSAQGSSEPDSFGEPLEMSSSFYYAPAKAPPPVQRKLDSFLDSEYGTAKYAEIDDVYGQTKVRNVRRRQKKQQIDHLYGVERFPVESDVEENPYDLNNNRSSSTPLYESTRLPVVSVKRRMSYSYGDYGYNHYHSIYSKLEEHRAGSERPTPIYDDVRFNKFKPRHFGLSSYGHLQIDYSCSWNNLDKYIYN